MLRRTGLTVYCEYIPWDEESAFSQHTPEKPFVQKHLPPFKLPPFWQVKLDVHDLDFRNMDVHVPPHFSLIILWRVLNWMPLDTSHVVRVQVLHSDHELSWQSTGIDGVPAAKHFLVFWSEDEHLPPHFSSTILSRVLDWMPDKSHVDVFTQALHSDHELTWQSTDVREHLRVFRNVDVHVPPHCSVVILWRLLNWVPDSWHEVAVQALHSDHELSRQLTRALE